MKKILKILGIILVILFAAIIVLPIAFKGTIIEKVKEEANNNLNATVEFGEFDLGLISSFPDFTFEIENVKVTGIEEFEGVKLADIEKLSLRIDLMSIIGGGTIGVKTIELIKPNLHVIVLKGGKANYDIAKESETDEVEEEPAEEEGSEDFQLSLKRLLISECNLIYDDRDGDMYAGIKNLNFELSGDFTADQTSLITMTTIEALTYKMEGVPYLNKAEIEVVATIDADLANSKYTFNDNTFRVNQLQLGLDGWLALVGEEDMEMDLKFNTTETTFKSILSLVPAVYKTDFESVQTDGSLTLNGMAKGKMAGESYPAFALNLAVKNAMFKYPDLPKSVDDIQIDLNVNSPGGDLDNTVVDLKKFHLKLAANPFDMTMLLKQPMSDPYIKAGFDGRLDLGSISDVIPLEEGDEMAGVITTNIHLEGNQSSIDNEQYEEFKAEGSLVVTSLLYKSSELSYDVTVKKIDMAFSPKFVALNSFDAMLGKSDFQASGKLENFIPYALDDSAVLKGNLNVNSRLLDLTELMEEEEAAEGTTEGSEESEEPMEVAEIPGNIDFLMNAQFNKIDMDSLVITNLKGQIAIKDHKMTMSDVFMNMLGGSITSTGYYETTDNTSPTFDFDMSIDHFDVQETMTAFNSVKEMAPLFKTATGQYSTSLTIKGSLNEQMDPKYETLYGLGKMKTHDMVVQNFKALSKIAKELKKDDLKNINMKNVDITYEIREGKVFMKPFDMNIGNIKTTASGWNSFDQTLEYNMDMAIPSSEFGGAANQMANSALKSISGSLGLGDQIALPEIINMRATITGTADDPKVKLKILGTEGGDSGSSAKDKIKDELDKKRKEAEEKARKEAEKLKREAEARKKQAEAEAKRKADEAKRKAQAEADRKKQEAERKAKEEAERQKKEAEKKAKDKLKGIFK